MYVISIETGLALDAKIITSHEACEGIAPMIVFSLLDEDDLFVLARSFENNVVVVIQREYDETVVGEMSLKGVDLGSMTRTFGDAGGTMQFLSQPLLKVRPCLRFL